MGRKSPQSVLKRAREQALREKREVKQAKKDARASARRTAGEAPEVDVDAWTPWTQTLPQPASDTELHAICVERS